MKNFETVKVIWFDELKGIGEGKTLNGKKIFLNVANMESDSKFLNLKSGEECFCEVRKESDQYFASKIKTVKDLESVVERGTFLSI